MQDAEQEGDQELVEFFSAVLENKLRAAQRAKEMLVPASGTNRSSRGAHDRAGIPKDTGPLPYLTRSGAWEARSRNFSLRGFSEVRV